MVPVRASPVPSVVRGSLGFFFAPPGSFQCVSKLAQRTVEHDEWRHERPPSPATCGPATRRLLGAAHKYEQQKRTQGAWELQAPKSQRNAVWVLELFGLLKISPLLKYVYDAAPGR